MPPHDRLWRAGSWPSMVGPLSLSFLSLFPFLSFSFLSIFLPYVFSPSYLSPLFSVFFLFFFIPISSLVNSLPPFSRLPHSRIIPTFHIISLYSLSYRVVYIINRVFTEGQLS